MTSELSNFAARLRALIDARAPGAFDFNALALELFALQFNSNLAYRKICAARGVTPATVSRWSQIPAVPTSAFKDFDVTSLPPSEREFVFHSSGTTGQRRSRHFHNAESLAVYEASLRAWWSADSHVRANLADEAVRAPDAFVILTPAADAAPHSSLVHMFDVLRRDRALPGSVFHGRVAADGSWTIDFDGVLRALQTAGDRARPVALFGTAFSFVHLLDQLAEKNVRLQLPAGSRALETGGYKGRSRSLPKTDLHALIADRLGIPASQIICEYGMSELSSQAYAGGGWRVANDAKGCFRFPPWARIQMVSPETGREAGDGETGLLRVFDLANVFSALAIQTEDLAVRRGDGFELLGRAALAEPRGCSLMAYE